MFINLPTLTKPRTIIERQVLKQRLIDQLDAQQGKHEQVRPLWLETLKQALQHGRDTIRTRFEKDHNGSLAMAGHAMLMDQIIRLIYELHSDYVFDTANPTKGEQLAIIAVGGYGRGELAPYSDIDLLFLYYHKLSPRLEQIIESTLYFLWDLRLKVGQSSRSINECMALCKKDNTIFTTLLEARFITGHRAFFDELASSWTKQVLLPNQTKLLDAKLKEREERHHRLGDSRYLLEPNIKDGKSGLRDLHMLHWGVELLFQTYDLAPLVEKEIISQDHAAQFMRAKDFLMTLRVHLHHWAGRAEERLTFTAQPEIAKRMGYKDHAGTSGTERLMKHYFLNARHIADLTRIFMGVFERAQQSSGWLSRLRPTKLTQKIDGFYLKEGRLLPVETDQFKTQPVDMIRLFKLIADYDLDPHPDCWRMLGENLKQITPNLRKQKSANRLFMDILCAAKNSENALRLMSESGVLGRFIPDFGRVVAQMQFDMYHIYTTDEHTIRAIGFLNQIERGLSAALHPLASTLLPRIQRREVLYLAVFLHDIAKGRGGDHSVIGAQIAHKLGPRFGLNKEETADAAWLVNHHLAMSKTATKRDLDDPKTIKDFVELVQSPELLRMLLCLTVVDIRAVGPNSWNNWKASLLRALYQRAEAAMLGGGVSNSQFHQRLQQQRDQLYHLLEADSWAVPDIEHYLAMAGEQYLLQFEPETLRAQANLVNNARLHPEQLHLTIDNNPVGDVTELTLCCPAHQGVFSRIAGSITMAGGEVIAATIATLSDGLTINHFIVQTSDGHRFINDKDIERLKTSIDHTLSGKIDVRQRMLNHLNRPLARREIEGTIQPSVFIDNDASNTKTVIEVKGRDRPGILYFIAGALAQQNLQLHSAKVSTYGEKLIDVFYVRDIYGHKITHPQKKRKLEQTLLDIFNQEQFL
ncbi:MAG: [protein-PII] uridylyltransferase [Alphaproteobacteria bacterium]